MFLVENAIPFQNATLVQGKFTVNSPNLLPGDMFLVEKDGIRIGMARFLALVNAKYSHNPQNPKYNITVGFDKDYRLLIGATFTKMNP